VHVPRTAASRSPRRQLGGHEPVRVGLEVHEAERIDRRQVVVPLREGAGVDQLLDRVRAEIRKW